MRFSKDVLDKNFKNIILSASVIIYCKASYAVDSMDLTSDASGGKTFSDVATSASSNFGILGTLFCAFFTLIGLCIVGVCLMKLKRVAESDGRENPVGPIVGLVTGGLLTGVSVLTFLIKNSVI
jgi:hypothetical protein